MNIEAILDRLRKHYKARTVTPGGAALTVEQLRRLYRAVLAEYGR